MVYNKHKNKTKNLKRKEFHKEEVKAISSLVGVLIVVEH